jgi:hypothetical protein
MERVAQRGRRRGKYSAQRGNRRWPPKQRRDDRIALGLGWLMCSTARMPTNPSACLPTMLHIGGTSGGRYVS